MEKHYIPGTEFEIYADRGMFSFGIDAILLSEFAKMKKNKVLVDIGTGTGIIGLRCLYKYNLKKVYGIELQKEVYNMFEKSIELNNLSDRVIGINKNLNDCYIDFENDSIDYIVSNPPYKKKNSGIINDKDNFSISRHEIAMVLEDIFKFAKLKLKDNGALYIVHRPERIVDLINFGRKYNLEPKSMRSIMSKKNTQPKMVLIKFIKNAGEFFSWEKPLIVYEENGEYTEEVVDTYYGKNKR